MSTSPLTEKARLSVFADTTARRFLENFEFPLSGTPTPKPFWELNELPEYP